jgi:hypothetical protein
MGLATLVLTSYSAGIMFITAKVDSSTQYLIADGLAGVGFAAPLTLLIVVAQLCTPPLLIGTASALMSTSRALGAAVATACYAAIFTSKLTPILGPNIASALIANGLAPANAAGATAGIIAAAGAAFTPALALRAPGMNADLVNVGFAAARQSYLEAYKYVWALLIAFSVLVRLLRCPSAWSC